jgi:hypothetical protein
MTCSTRSASCCWRVPAGEQTVTLSNGSKYDVYDFFGYSLGCA